MSTLSAAVDAQLERSTAEHGWRPRFFQPREFFHWTYREPTPETAPWFAEHAAGRAAFPPCDPGDWLAIWRSMERVGLAADAVRMDVGPLAVTPAGGVRFAAVHHLKHAAVPGSRHFIGDAFDLRPLDKSTTCGDVFAFADRAQRDGSIAPGGLALYPTFVHIDARGHRARWST